MKKLFLFSALLISFVFTSTAAANDMQFSASLLKFDRETEGPTIGTGEQKWLMYDLKLGTLLSKNFYLGAIYSAYDEDVSGTQNKRSMWGGTVGYHGDNGCFIDGSYFLQAQLALGGVHLKSGSGYAIDLGCNTMVGSSFFFGVQGSYKSVSYSKKEAVSETNKEKSELYPMLNLGLVF
jgi:hypothetical protein